MAAPIVCDNCHEQESRFMVSDQETAETTAWCLSCYAMQGLALAIAVFEPATILEQVGPVHVAAFQAERGGSKAKGRRRSEPAAEPEPEPRPQAPEGVEEPEASAADG